MKVLKGFVLALVLFTSAAWVTDQVVRVARYLTVNTSTKDGALTVQGDGTNDIANFRNSSGTSVVEFDADGDVAVVQSLTVDNQLNIDNDGVSDVAVKIEATSGQAVDVLQITAYDGSTEFVDVSSAGLLGAKKGLAVTGDFSIDGTAGLDASSIVIDGNTLTFVEGILTACGGAGCP